MPRPPRIGVVAYEMEGRPSGVGRFLEGLLSGLVEIRSAATWLLFFQGEPFDHPLFAAAAEAGVALRPHFDGRPRMRPIAWEQLRLPRLLRETGADAVFSPGYSLPLLSDLPGLLTLHDLAFESRPEEFRPRERWRRRLLARVGARRASRVLASSRFGAAELGRRYRVPPARLRILPGAVAPRYFAAGEEEADLSALAELGVRPPYLLWLATLLPRRPVAWALTALRAAGAARPGLTLVLAGQDRLPDRNELARLLAESRLGERVVRLPFAPDELLPALYRGAELTLYPSAYEGFGLPPLESLAAGSAAVVTAGQALEEIWPEYPYLAPFSEAGFVGTVLRALADPQREVAVARARELVAGLTWRASAAALEAEVAEVLANAGSRP
ncbi:MAG: glycosyltransferase family 4 protein [Thermoanaerobaculia bacterium]|nr:glycosyltransferase family 4 protein [Thermoanaerobaculia bacterium]